MPLHAANDAPIENTSFRTHDGYASWRKVMNLILMPKDELIATLFSRDIEHLYILPAQRREYGEYAWQKGKRIAEGCRVAYFDALPSDLAKQLCLTVKDKDGSGHYFSEYTSNRSEIVLFKNVIQNNFIELEYKHLVSGKYEEIRELFIAHELFHHMECHDPTVGITYRERKVTIFSLGPIKLKTGIRSLSEIGAHSFTRHFVSKDLFV
jgi:hypothetical protein